MPARSVGHPRRPLGVALVAAMGALALLLTATAPASAVNVKVDHRIFGLHDGSLDSLTASHVGSLRLWDAGVNWRQIETAPGSYDFSRLDNMVAAARAKHVEVTLVLGQTPGTFSDDPAVLPMTPVSGAENPALTDFRDYVNAVMARYKSRIAAYQVWNEANVVDYWKGTPAEMAKLTKIVYQARNANAPHSLVVSAPLTTRLAGQRRWLKQFAATKVGGTKVFGYLNALALNLYPMARYGARIGVPEDSMKLLAKSRSILSDARWPSAIPIWNTEVNYGFQTGSLHKRAKAIPNAEQVANVIRTYALNAAGGVKRVFWYSWDLAGLNGGGSLGNTLLTNPAHHTRMTAAGKAFVLVQSWLKGTLVGSSKSKLPCTKDKHGTYTCEVRYPTGVGRIYWNPTKRATVTVAKSAKKVQDEFGKTTSIKGGSTRKVDFKPILVRSHA